MNATLVVSLLLPVVTGLVAAAGLYLKEWHLDRDDRNVRDQALSDARAEIAFASDWWQAHQLLGPDAASQPTQRMLQYLADAEAIVAETQDLARRQKTPVTFRRVFLLEPMHRLSARIVRWAFFTALAFSVLGILTIVIDASSSKTSKEVGDDIYAVITFMIVLVVLRFVAAGLEHRTAITDVADSDANAMRTTGDFARPGLASS